ncbi:hypothetical protein K7X08_018335 [Anisodus acutangulus]|uniref:Uncharacterized protein n=1 Tax=Anisodus acutangulus TaxID=402998 RepID=A0A9Q1LZ05_9SOLA|nr:hypothetical protein K7X08_018335 [Anisodus acutangulus]
MKKSKISWAPGRNFCQVNHFLQEDCPSKVGRGSQHHLQLKRSHQSIIHQSIIRPSLEGRSCLKQSKERLPYIPLAKWKCPPKFNLNEKWLVVAGEESKEAEDQDHREKRVLEAVYPSRSAIPPNPSTLSDLDQYYDDDQTPVIRTIPIEEEADVEVSSHLTPSQNISIVTNNPSSSVSMVTSEKLPANGKSFPLSLTTFQNPRKPPSNSPFPVRRPANVQSAPAYLSRCQNLKGSEQTQISPKPPVSYNSVPQYPLTCKNLSTPDQTEFSPDLPANQNHAPKCRTVCGNQNTSQRKSQVSGMPPANHNPVTQLPSTGENPNIPQHQAEALPKSLANHNPATQSQLRSQVSGMPPPANQNPVTQFSSTCENSNISQHQAKVLPKSLANHNPATQCNNQNSPKRTQVSPKPPVSNNSVPHYPLTCKLTSTPDQTEFSPDLPANQNHAPKCLTVRGNQNISQLKSQVSGMPPTNHNPVTQFPSTCQNPNIPLHQAEVLPKSLANHNPATQCEKSILEMSHGFDSGDLMVAVATTVAALAKSQEQGSLIDTDLLVKLLRNPEQIQKLMNEHGVVTNPKTGPASGSKPTVPSSTTPTSTADSLDKQVTGNENCKCVVADSTVFSLSLEVRSTNEQRGTAAMSRPVDLLVPLPRTKPDKVINKSINEYQAPHAGSGPIFGPKPMAKSVPLTMTKPETSVKNNLANEQGAPPHVGNADIRSKPLVHPTSDLNLEKIKKLINEYGVPDNVGGKALVNSELVPSSFSKCDVALQPELQIKSHSPNTGHASPFSSMTSPAPLHKDVNYYKSLIKQHGENRESVDHELLQNTNPRGNTRGGPELLKNVKPNERRQRKSGAMLEAPGSKRIKLSGEVTGRT